MNVLLLYYHGPTSRERLEVILEELVFCLAQCNTHLAHHHGIHVAQSHQWDLVHAVCTHHLATSPAVVLCVRACVRACVCVCVCEREREVRTIAAGKQLFSENTKTAIKVQLYWCIYHTR